MQNKKIISFVQSLILLPALTLNPVSFNMSNEAPKVEAGPVVQTLKIKAQAIDEYFEARSMPMKGLGEKLALEAEKNGLDWRLLAAISVRESTGGKFACKKAGYNAFGWGSCKIGFDSHEDAIEVVARNLGGNNPKTAKRYAGKTTKGILQTYNPPSIVLRYAEQVMAIMDTISEPTPELKKELAQASA